VLLDRVIRRSGHYMPASLLDSQLETLEAVEADEPGATLDANRSRDEVVAELLETLAGRTP
jgi:gluconate kinase